MRGADRGRRRRLPGIRYPEAGSCEDGNRQQCPGTGGSDLPSLHSTRKTSPGNSPKASAAACIAPPNCTAATTAALEAWLRDNRGDVATEVQFGGQPLYPYLFGVE